MPRFYFETTVTGTVLPDEEGVDLPSLDIARRDAMATAAAIAKDHGAPTEVIIDIQNEEHLLVAVVRLSLRCEEPARLGRRSH